MAEAVLYGNNDEPSFPYEAVANAIKWVPEYVQKLTPKRGRNFSQEVLYDILINALLVFCRARTSAMFPNVHVSICNEFVDRLNQTLCALSNTGATHHHTEIVHRNNNSFFITCSKSPRFIWKQKLDHREVGLNLDYAAAGHIGPSDGERKGVSICEISGNAHTPISGEVVHFDHIADFASIENFIQLKTSLFNSSMMRLQLPYRFAYFWKPRRNDENIKITLNSNIPPSPQWWKENYIFLARYPYSMAYASNDTLFHEYWCVITAAFQLAEKLAAIKRPVPRECPKRVEDLFSKVYRATQPSALDAPVSPHPSSTTETLIANLLAEIAELELSLQVEDERTPLERKAEDYVLRRSDLRYSTGIVCEWIKIRTMERGKLRAPLIHSGVRSWPKDGDERWTAKHGKGRNLVTKVTDFFFDKKVPM